VGKSRTIEVTYFSFPRAIGANNDTDSAACKEKMLLSSKFV
jgi:hypothetical protein